MAALSLSGLWLLHLGWAAEAREKSRQRAGPTLQQEAILKAGDILEGASITIPAAFAQRDLPPELLPDHPRGVGLLK